MPQRTLSDPAHLRARIAADLAAGKTVALSRDELADPHVRQHLPELLEELTRQQATTNRAPFVVPGFTLLGEIGQGGMSTVWLARQDALQRHVALKIAPKWLAGDKRMQERMLQEARAMARVAHPHIVAIHDILEVDDTIAITMDWIDGLTLARLLEAMPPQPDAEDMPRIREALGTPPAVPPFASNATRWFVQVVRDIARAVQRVHDAGLLHLDIKPSNILVRRDGTALLADFGVVREIDLTATHTRTFAGTPVYAAPEQLRREDDRFGPHTDVYSLGITLYELLARQQPLQRLGLTRLLTDVGSGRIARLAAKLPVAPDLANIVQKAISPEPHRRYASAGALADDLEAFLQHRPVAARPLTRLQRLQRWARHEPWKAGLAGVLAITIPTLLVLGTYLLLQMPRIERARHEERQARVNHLRHAAFQGLFTYLLEPGAATATLRRAMELDPSASSLACLLAMAYEENSPLVEELLRAEAAQVEAHLGLRLFAHKVAARRPFFDDGEVGQLRASAEPVDNYVLALDRLFFAEDREYEEAYQQADAALEAAGMLAGVDALLLGLRAWTSLRSDRRDVFEATGRAIRHHWPGDGDALAWLYYSMDPKDRTAARAIADEILATHPDRPLGYELLAGGDFRVGDHTAALAHVAAARRAGVTSTRLDDWELLSLAQRDGKEAAERALRTIPAERLLQGRRLGLLRLVDPAAADEARAQLLARPRMSPSQIGRLYRDARRHGHAEHVEAAWEAMQEQHPGRLALHHERTGDLWKRKDLPGAAKLLREVVLPRHAPAGVWLQACSLFASAPDWTALATFAGRWAGLAPDVDRRTALAYRGLAASRLGDPEKAAEWFTIALAGPPLDQQWYTHILLEDAWLRAVPSTREDLRDRDLARRRLAAFEALAAKNPRLWSGPWTNLVRAEVAFANGEREAARQALQRATRLRQPERFAPSEWQNLLQDAQTRYGAQ